MSALQEFGFTKEEIEQKVVAKIADQLLTEYFYDAETGEEPRDTHLAIKFHEIIKKYVDRQINKLAEEYVVPHVKEIIESVCIRATNQWGEAKGEPKTFVEYLTESAQAYLSQPVNYEGKPETSSYGRNTQTRLVHLVHQHLHYSIDTAMKNAVEIVKAKIAPALEETCKMKLNEITSTLKVSLTAKS